MITSHRTKFRRTHSDPAIGLSSPDARPGDHQVIADVAPIRGPERQQSGRESSARATVSRGQRLQAMSLIYTPFNFTPGELPGYVTFIAFIRIQKGQSLRNRHLQRQPSMDPWPARHQSGSLLLIVGTLVAGVVNEREQGRSAAYMRFSLNLGWLATGYQ